MTLKFKDDGGTDRTITAIQFMDDGGTDRTIERIKLGTKVIFSITPDISVVLSLDSVGADAGGTGVATTVTVTATPSGGTAPYTYLWTLEDIVGSGSPTIDSTTTAATSFSITGIATDEFCTATARCTAKDADLFSASATCAVSFYGGFSGGGFF